VNDSALSFAEFKTRYDTRLERVFSFWTREMQDEIARHCAGWHSSRFDFRVYLERSAQRFHRAYLSLVRRRCRSVCDVGGLWGLLPVVLRDLGFDVCMTEAKSYYSEAFDPLFAFVEECGVEIMDYDPFSPDAHLGRRFDGVLLMAILEHYPHSLRGFMANVKRLLDDDGVLYIEVPNIAYWPKRWAMLAHGATPLAPIEEIYESETPFIGHHHEFTMRELRALVRLSDLEILQEDYFNYSVDILSVKDSLRRPWLHLVPAFVQKARECLVVVCRRTAR